jgi:ABC-2 type transport system ATP-binding protein
MNCLIEIRNLSKDFKKQQVLKKLNLKFEKNLIYGIIGRNGTGKSVLLKLITGLLKPTDGDIIVNGKVIGKDIDFPLNTGILFDYDFLPNYTAFENLKLVVSLDNAISDYQIYQLLETVELNNERKKKYKNFSSGMKQKLRIAQSLIGNPELLILDEPFNGLDSNSVEKIRNLLLKLRDEGKTILLTSHYKEDIDKLCDQVYEIIDGNVLSIKRESYKNEKRA